MIVKIEYGPGFVQLPTSYDIEVKGMPNPPAPVDLTLELAKQLQHPVKAKSLLEIAKEKKARNFAAHAVIVVSDNTRPVPYYGKQGLIYPVIQILHRAGFADEKITILIGAGSHRNMDPTEVEDMIGLHAMGMNGVHVVNHEYDTEEMLASIGTTNKGSHAQVNKLYHEADLKIVTGLVESHFMAGASGGRKGICPGIVGKETLKLFHGPKFLSSHYAADLILDGNPLHEEALEIAEMAGCDFLINVTIDDQKRTTGVFAGDLKAAHEAAVEKIKSYVTVPMSGLSDIIIIPAGFVGINHYQTAKAAIEASRAVKPGGKIIVVAHNTDQDPIGGEGYKEALKLLKDHGPGGFMELIRSPGWQMVQEQWQVQMWCKVFEILKHTHNLYYCALEIPASDYGDLPGIAGIEFLNSEEQALPKVEAMELMVQRVMSHATDTSAIDNPTICLLKDGPYGVPLV